MMGRIRTIKPEFFTHDGLFDAEQETGLPLRLAFAGLWTQCDREGRFPWRPRQLKVAILPFDEIDFSRVLDALATRGFVVKYASEGREFGHIPSWHRHQVINNRETASVLPQPTEVIDVSDALGTRAARVWHAPSGEGKGREGKGRENISRKTDFRGADDTADADPIETEFCEIFWPSYPRKEDKKDALAAFRKARKKVSLETIMASLKSYGQKIQGKEKQFIRTPARFLNAEGWQDGNDQPAELIADNETWVKRLRHGRRQRQWSVKEWGPPPGAAGCIVPAALIEPGDGEGWTAWELAA